MTMEAWALGLHLHPLRLVLLLAATVPTLVLLQKYGGFRKSTLFRDRVADALVAILVAAIAATAILLMFGIVTADMPLREVIGKIAVQVVHGKSGGIVGTSATRPEPLGG